MDPTPKPGRSSATRASSADSSDSLFTTTAEHWITAYCDGGSRGNPGPAGYGVYIQDDAGRVVGELSEYLGKRTNNFAEYSGLLAALEFAIGNGHPCLRVISDSELMVKQMKGQYRVNSPELRPLFEQAKRLALKLDRFEIRHVLRDKNRHADQLANDAMDRGMGRGAAKIPIKVPVVQNASPERTAVLPPKPPETRQPETKMLRGFVKGGVVHVLGGDLPDGIFVKVIPE
jgi:ribonuclease HI